MALDGIVKIKFGTSILEKLHNERIIMSKIEFREMLRENHKKMLLSKKETANELNISEATIDRLRQQGQISSRKVLGQVMFSLDEVARFIYDS